MILDSSTLVMAAAACMAVVSIVFSIVTAVRSNDHAGRLWSVMFLSMTVSLGATGAAGLTTPAPIGWEAVAAGTASLTVGCLWSGFRAFGERPARVDVTLAVAAAVTALAAVGAATADQNAAQVVSQSAILLQSLLVVREIRRSPLAANLHILILQATVIGVVVIAVVNAVAASLGGELLNTSLLDALYAPLGVVAAMCLGSARVERGGSSGVLGASRQQHETLPMIETETFNDVVDDRLERLGLAGGHAALIVIQLSELAEINTAFGRRVGDRALRALAEVIRRTAPPWSVLGHGGAGRFWVFASAAGHACADELEEKLRSALSDHSAASLHLPLVATLGSSDTYRSAMDREALQADAIQSLGAKLLQI